MRTLLHTLAVLLGRDAPHSQVTPAELELLLSVAEQASTIVELGCYEGKTAVAMALRSRGVVTTIDPFPRGRLPLRYGEIVTRTHVRRSRARNVKVLRSLSSDAVANWAAPIDLLFIDADHAYDAVQADYESWLPKVKSGGHIAMHDVRPVGDARDSLGSIQFYRNVVSRDARVSEIASEWSLALLRKH